MWLLSKSQSSGSARHQMQIREVSENILVLPNHEYRMILETSSINFELKSDQDQDMIIDAFQNFLNSLPCPIQIVIRVREIDIDRYAQEQAKKQLVEQEAVYKTQIEAYARFIQTLVSGNKILSRRFFIVIPYRDSSKKRDMELIKEHLSLNRDIILKGLEKIGMKGRMLESLEILELFYGFYNPDQAKTQLLRGKTAEALVNHLYA